VLTPDTLLRQVGELARSVGATVLVDEVYLDLVYEGTPRSSFHLGEEFVVTSSLTKAYGLSGLRCGWVLARPELAWRMRRLNDLFGATPVHVGELISVVAFKHLPFLRDRARRIVEADRRLLDDFFAHESGLSIVRAEWGTTAFPRLRRGPVEDLVNRLRAEFETSVVPGAFFEMPEHFRIGAGVETAAFAEGLKRIRQALASLRLEPADAPR
jgi:aspartate/methionine/tyrosine aminotransferase